MVATQSTLNGLQISTGRSPQTARIAVLVGFAWLIAGFALLRAADAGSPTAPPNVVSKLDPNTATWWELSLLPQIGAGRAKQIVEYRESGDSVDHPAFVRPADLNRVQGIGPKTVQRIAPYLRFPSQ